MPEHDFLLVGCVSDAAVMGDCDPIIPCDFFKPIFVAHIVREMIGVPFDGESRMFEDFRENAIPSHDL